jgi:hypothetical protein
VDLYGLLKLIVRDVATNLRATLSERSVSTKEAHALAITDIVALAALADGQVSREELRALEDAQIGEGEIAVAAAERLYQLEASAEDIQSPEWLEVKIGDLAMALDRDERRAALRLVESLAAHGARLKTRELPGGRVVGVTERELVELFARGLGIAPHEIEAENAP